jgi:two-component system chemotaxis response regulator CheB
MSRVLVQGKGLHDVDAVVIGGSAGAVSALLTLLPALPADFPLPVVVVIHIARHHIGSLAEVFQSQSRLVVKEAEDKEPLVPGTVYLAPADYHVLVEPRRYVSLSNEEPVNFSRPSIDVLFGSAADAYGDTLLAIVLTGANRDGAQGLAAVCDAGGLALVQTPESAEAPAMPAAALAACPQAESMSLAAISEVLCSAA